MITKDRDTIFALSSGTPPAAIAIVRLSGPAAGIVMTTLAGALPVPRMATLRNLRTPAGDLLDRALLLWFPGPDSATGEDLAEFHLHGGRAVVAAVLVALGALPDCRSALPGEFTRRAFMNGRIDLAQAEALGDLLAAETELQRRQAVHGIEGALGRLVAAWRSRLVQLAAEVEAELDFADEGDVAARLRDPRPAITALAEEIHCYSAAPASDRLRDGVRVVIAGPPNSGKSSLLNVLAGRDAAIVSDVAGTTRDRIEVPLALDGIPLLLTDTAGLHDSDDPVERIGIARAKDAVRAADILLWLGDAEEAPVPGDGAQRLILHSRADLPDRLDVAQGADVAVSIFGRGLNELRHNLAVRAAMLVPGVNGIAVNQRQRHAILSCESHLRTAASIGPIECLADDLRRAVESLDLMAGLSAREDVIDAVFAGFCLGK